jgi:prepilin-type N-terminal cleavage/methylation domain-containing protein/prepilin-type processing-associated H-X9-DG protein
MWLMRLESVTSDGDSRYRTHESLQKHRTRFCFLGGRAMRWAILPGRHRAGFTLIECLVVILVIAVLAALLIPAVQMAREAARHAQCASNLKQFALAVHNYSTAAGSLPMGGQLQLLFSPGLAPAWETSAGHFVALLPQLEQQPLFNAVNFDISIWNAPNTTISATGITLLWCPSDPASQQPRILPDPSPGDMTGQLMNYTSYAGNIFLFVQHHGVQGPSVPPVRFADVNDGLSETILLGEKTHTALVASGDPNAVYGQWWTSGHDSDTRIGERFPPNAYRTYPVKSGLRLEALRDGASSLHPGGANFAFADGSVCFLKETIGSWRVDSGTDWRSHPGTYQSLMTPKGGEVVSADDY